MASPESSSFDQLIHFLTTPYRVLRWICLMTGLVTLMFVAGLGGYAWSLWKRVPDLGHMSFVQLQELASKRVKARLGGKTPPVWTPLAEVSRDYLYSVVMSEDSSFFDHDGINYDAVMNAAINNWRKKKYEYGASTISQQVVKNVFLSDEKTLGRKVVEILTTYSLERHFTKNQILEIYLNVAEVGPDLYGARDASQHYFKKQPSEINAAEGAFIAVMLPSPRKFHYTLFENKNLTTQKRGKIRRILGDMLASEFISQKQYHRYWNYNYFTHLE